MSAALFREAVIHYERKEHPTSIHITTETGKSFIFSDEEGQPIQLRLGALKQVVGPGDTVPEEYQDNAPDLSPENTMVAFWLADRPDDPPHNFWIFCSQDKKEEALRILHPKEV